MTGADAARTAEFDRRLHAFALDLVLVAVVVGALGLCVGTLADSWTWAVVAGLAAGLVAALALGALSGVLGSSPGKAAFGLRVLDVDSGEPIGLAPGLLRTVIVLLALLPTAGLGAGWLAWSALSDPRHTGRGWHDRRTGSWVCDTRELPAEPAQQAQREMVNLTALRLAPAPVADLSLRVAPATAGVRSSRRTADGWRLTFDTGESLRVEGLTLIGRDPQPREGEQPRHLVALPSPDLVVSKTHLQVQVVDGVLVVTDRGSTNGSMLTRQGVSRELRAGRPATLVAGDEVLVGEHRMDVSRE